jgi:hypothetical protein
MIFSSFGVLITGEWSNAPGNHTVADADLRTGSPAANDRNVV